MSRGTIADVLNELGIGEDFNKTASQTTEINQLDKLAMDLGVVGKNNENQSDDTSLNKEASVKGLDQVYATLFPEDLALTEKVASLEVEGVGMDKEAAAIEESMGARAHDVFVELFDARITKIASDIVGKLADNEDESGNSAGVKEDTSEAEKILGLNPEGAVGEFKKKASALAPELAEEVEALYSFGSEKLAREATAAMDKVASEKKEEDEKEEKKELSEEHKKEAFDRGAIMEQGFYAGLCRDGFELHGDASHYLKDALVEKIASYAEIETAEEYEKIAGKVEGFLKNMANKAKGQAKSVAHNAKDAATGVSTRHGGKLSNEDRLKAGAKALGKAGLAAGAVGAAGYGAKKALSDDK